MNYKEVLKNNLQKMKGISFQDKRILLSSIFIDLKNNGFSKKHIDDEIVDLVLNSIIKQDVQLNYRVILEKYITSILFDIVNILESDSIEQSKESIINLSEKSQLDDRYDEDFLKLIGMERPYE